MFPSRRDRLTYLGWLREKEALGPKSRVLIHCLMSNHVHLIGELHEVPVLTEVMQRAYPKWR